MTAIEKLLQQGTTALKARARKLLRQVVHRDERNEMAPSAAVDGEDTRRGALRNALAIDSGNEAAQRALDPLAEVEDRRPEDAATPMRPRAEPAGSAEEQLPQPPDHEPASGTTGPQATCEPRVVKRGKGWAVEGAGDGWVFEKTFHRLWRAKLALQVFQDGGRVSDYWRVARKGQEGAKEYISRERLSARVVKQGSGYEVVDAGATWITEKTFDTKVQAETALDVFKHGGSAADYAKAVRTRSIHRLRARSRLDPMDADLHLELALKLLRVESSTHYQDCRFISSRHKDEANEHLNLALALILDSYLDRAKARFLLVELTLSAPGIKDKVTWTAWRTKGKVTWTAWRTPPREGSAHDIDVERAKAYIQSDPALQALTREIVSDAKKHLRRFPHDIQALNLQKVAYSLLGNQPGLGRAELSLREARSLEKAGLIGRENTASRRKTTSRRRKNGVDLEQTTEKLLQAMGLKAATTSASGDGGIDIVAYSESPVFSGKYIVQCKDWINPVGEPVVCATCLAW